MQLLVVTSEERSSNLGVRIGEELSADGAGVVIYEDVNDPLSYGVLTYAVDPSLLLSRVRPALRRESLGSYSVRHDMSMMGRTYSSGYEQDLRYWLLDRPVETVQNPDWPWAVWYPLRRSGAFEKLEPREKGGILREHAEIGKAYGTADLAHDVRLACHGLDANDNEFLIGLIGKDLAPLSQVVQKMRATRQTSEFIVQMGPFFVGRAIYRSPWTQA
jgi:chlorite dismutase